MPFSRRSYILWLFRDIPAQETAYYERRIREGEQRHEGPGCFSRRNDESLDLLRLEKQRSEGLRVRRTEKSIRSRGKKSLEGTISMHGRAWLEIHI